MLSGHFTCMGSDLLSVMNSMLRFWAESSCFLTGMLIQHKISLKSLNTTLFRIYNTKTFSTFAMILKYLLILTSFFIANFLGYGLYGK